MNKKRYLIAAFLMMSLIWINNSFGHSYKQELACMTEAIFKESNTESVDGKIAVAHVIMNRVKDSKNKFPKTICGVVNHSHFTYKDKTNNNYKELSSIAHKVITGKIRDNTNGSTHFHHEKVRPYWSRVYIYKTRYGKHLFYKYNYETFE